MPVDESEAIQVCLQTQLQAVTTIATLSFKRGVFG